MNIATSDDDALDYDALDPGIRQTVRWLRARGFRTTDSGDGVSKADLIASGDALDVAHVFIVPESPAVLVDEARRLFAVLRTAGVVADENEIEASYDPTNDVPLIALIGIDDERLRLAASTAPS